MKRLAETYSVQDIVEIFLQAGDEGQWVRGRVEAFDFPGVWIRTEDGYRWFVTNGTRIRPDKNDRKD